MTHNNDGEPLHRLASTESSAAQLTVSGPAELLAVVPYLIGFHPSRSAVLVGLSGERVLVTVRWDLPAEDSVTIDETLGTLAAAGVRRLIVAIYAEQHRGINELPYAGHVAQIARAAHSHGCPVSDALLIDGTGWRSYWPNDGAGFVAGQLLATDSSRVAAEATLAGLVALPDRGSVLRLLCPHPGGERLALLPKLRVERQRAVGAVGEARLRSVKRALFATCRRVDALGGDGARQDEGLTDDEVARFGVALRRDTVRDALWLAVDDGRLDGRPLWRELAARLPDPYPAAPLLLFGWRSWRAGDGVLAREAAEQAVHADPGYSAADLLFATLNQVIDPRRLPRLRRSRPA